MPSERYTHGHAPATLRQHGARTAEEAAAFLLPALQPDMRLLDVGCGPGSITRGLASRLPSGHVVGVDRQAAMLAAPRAEATGAGSRNLSYCGATAYSLPFRDAVFDVVYAHQVLQHLREPALALVEMQRVMKPGGLMGLRDVDWGTVSYWPLDPWIERFLAVHVESWRRNGGEPRMGRALRALANSAGLEDVEVSAALWCYTTPEQTAAWGDAYAERILTSPMGQGPVEYGLVTREDLTHMADAFRRWAAHPDAFWAFTHVAVLGRKPRT